MVIKSENELVKTPYKKKKVGRKKKPGPKKKAIVKAQDKTQKRLERIADAFHKYATVPDGDLFRMFIVPEGASLTKEQV